MGRAGEREQQLQPFPSRTGANRGIGLELVKQLLAKNSSKVVATARKPAEAAELQRVARGSEGRVEVLQLDVASSISIQQWVGELKSSVPQVDVSPFFPLLFLPTLSKERAACWVDCWEAPRCLDCHSPHCPTAAAALLGCRRCSSTMQAWPNGLTWRM